MSDHATWHDTHKTQIGALESVLGRGPALCEFGETVSTMKEIERNLDWLAHRVAKTLASVDVDDTKLKAAVGRNDAAFEESATINDTNLQQDVATREHVVQQKCDIVKIDANQRAATLRLETIGSRGAADAGASAQVLPPPPATPSPVAMLL